MAYTTPKAEILVRMFAEAGATPYPILRGQSDTTKVARFLMPNGNPVAVSTNCKTPRVWLLREHERGEFAAVGKVILYAPEKSRSWHLDQMKEFTGRALTKVEVISESWPDIRRAVEAICAHRPAERA